MTYQLYNDDCMKVLPTLPSASVDAVITDPPYGVHAMEWDSVIPHDFMWRELERIVKPKGNIILFGTGLFAYKLALSNERLFRYDLVWKKSKCGSPLTAKLMPMKKHELVLVFGRSAAKYNPQLEDGVPYSRHFTKHRTNNLKLGNHWMRRLFTNDRVLRRGLTDPFCAENLRAWAEQGYNFFYATDVVSYCKYISTQDSAFV